MQRSDVAVVGTGQTTYRRSHPLDTLELASQAALRALEDSGLSSGDIDVIVFGVAPDVLAGWQSIERSAVPGLAGTPIVRVNTGGSTGAAAFLSGVEYLQSKQFDTALVVGLERMGHAQKVAGAFNSIFDPLTERGIPISTLSMVAMRATRLMMKYGYNREGWARIAVRNFLRAVDNPYAQVSKSLTISDVLDSPMLSWPISRYDACPSSEGACATILTREEAVPRGSDAAWVAGHASRSNVYEIGHRLNTTHGEDLIDLPTLRHAASEAYSQAGISDVYRQVQVMEIHAPFTHAEAMSYAPLGLCEPDEGPSLLEDEEFLRFGNRICLNPSGGPQVANPVGATALVRIIEAANQVRGKAGRTQADGVQTALATGQGGTNQFSTCTVLTQNR